MKNQILKSTWAVVAGFLFVVILSIATDMILSRIGMMKQPFYDNSTGLIIWVTVYRFIYQVVGSYFTARLAPEKPMRHAMIGGFIGLGLSITGAIVMKEEGPSWYAIALIILALPSAWLGGYLFMNSISKQQA
ncbi:MAG: hypothetical protein ABI761_20020 [Saprospiraceae bacterium]